MEEKLISFETAKLAKEKGFNIDTGLAYVVSETLFNNESESYKEGDLLDTVWEHENFPFIRSHIAFAVNQALLQKWLRITHELHIDCYPFDGVWELLVVTIDGHNLAYDTFDVFKTYEEALETGLLEALKLV